MTTGFLAITKPFHYLIITLFLASFFNLSSEARSKETILVFAAASLKDALEPVGQDFETDTGIKVRISFAGTSTLARQLEAGAPADLLISADLEWITWLENKELVKSDTKVIIAKNRLALAGSQNVEPKGASIAEVLQGFLKQDGERFAIADPDHIPAGRYARSALEALGLYDQLRPHFAISENARLNAVLIARGETPIGIVYRSDIDVDPALKLIGLFDENTHDPIIYPAILTKQASQSAETFLKYLKQSKAAQHYLKAGLEVAR